MCHHACVCIADSFYSTHIQRLIMIACHEFVVCIQFEEGAYYESFPRHFRCMFYNAVLFCGVMKSKAKLLP